MKFIHVILMALQTGTARVSRAVQPELITFVVGLGLLAVGLWMAWPPLGLIGPGVVLIAASRDNGGSKPND